MLTQLLILCAGLSLLQSGALAKAEKMNPDEEWISSLIELLELDYEDICLNKAEADWAVLERMVDAIQEKLEADKHYGYFVHTQVGEVRVAFTDQVRLPLLLRKVNLFTQPGDTMLESDQWNELVSFGVGSIYDLESANDYKCRTDLVSNCSYSDLQTTMATSRDSHLLLSAKASWEKKLPDDVYYLTHVLPLLKNASILNGFNSVQDYWDSLAEYGGALTRARDLWADVAPLYSQLAKYVAMRLTKHNATMRTDGNIPSYNLGSLLGDDWSNIAPLLVPQQLVYKDILTNLNHKHIGGREAFKVAAKMLQSLGLGDLHPKIWRDSAFDKTCPARLINFCQPGNMRVFTCNKISINNYLDAHEIVMRIKHKEIAASLSTNSFILREPNRFSAFYEAIAGFASLLAISPSQLDKVGILPLKAYGVTKYKFNNKIVLQLLIALRDLPRLNYYLAADEWRLKIAASNIPPTQLGSSWPEMRRNFSFVSPSDKDFLGDPTILMNKPYIGQFLGTIMKYQILETFTADLYSEEADVVEQVSLNIARVKSVLEQAHSKEWPELVHDLLGQQGLSANAIVEYFRPLKEFLDAELDPSSSNEQFYDDEFDYDLDKMSIASENDEEILQHLPEKVLVEEDAELKEVPLPPTIKTEPEEEHKVVEQVQLIQEISTETPIDHIDHLDMQDKAENSASAVGSPEKADIQEASTQIYVWIGLAIVIAIVLILATIIARKRYKHKKELEKERKRQEAGA